MFITFGFIREVNLTCLDGKKYNKLPLIQNIASLDIAIRLAAFFMPSQNLHYMTISLFTERMY